MTKPKARFVFGMAVPSSSSRTRKEAGGIELGLTTVLVLKWLIEPVCKEHASVGYRNRGVGVGPGRALRATDYSVG